MQYIYIYVSNETKISVLTLCSVCLMLTLENAREDHIYIAYHRKVSLTS